MSDVILHAVMPNEATPPGKEPFAQLVDPTTIQAAAQRIAGLGLPRLVVKAFSDKEKEKEKTPRRVTKTTLAHAA